MTVSFARLLRDTELQLNHLCIFGRLYTENKENSYYIPHAGMEEEKKIKARR